MKMHLKKKRMSSINSKVSKDNFEDFLILMNFIFYLSEKLSVVTKENV